MKTKTAKTKKDAPVATLDATQRMSARTSDLTDSARDQERLRPEVTTIELPDVEDIPGQEYIKPPTLESFVDDTIASADEEGPVTKRKKDKDEAQEIFREEDEGLNDSTDSDDYNLRRAELDNTDDDGDALNEEEDLSGDDLDIPGSADDDDDEAIGEEDEENNSWSLEGEKEDDEISKHE